MQVVRLKQNSAFFNGTETLKNRGTERNQPEPNTDATLTLKKRIWRKALKTTLYYSIINKNRILKSH